MRRALAWGLLAGVLAGCSGDTDAATSEGPSRPTPEPMPVEGVEETSDASPLARIIPEAIHWTDCQGLYTKFRWPASTSPAAPFPGWEPDAYITTEVRMMALECHRFGFGAIERGPIRFLLEYHNNHSVPPKCQAEEGPIQYWILQSIWVDDPEVTAALLEEGMPAAYSSMQATEQQGAAMTRSWTWGVEAKSSLQAHQEQASSRDFSDIPPRLFWLTTQGVSWMDLGLQSTSPTFTDRVVNGTMNPPMIMARASPDYVGTGAMLDDVQLDGVLERFGDQACEQPLH